MPAAFGSGRAAGIVCVNKRRLDELAAGKIPSVYPKLFGQADGMLAEECSSGFFPAGLKTKSGLLWFSTLKGVAVVDPRAQPTDAPAQTVLEEVLVDGWRNPCSMPPIQIIRGEVNGPELKHRNGNARITPGKHRVEFRYTGLSFDAPEQMRFRYRLEGLDTDWVDAGTRRTAFYSYLPPGDYGSAWRRVTATGSGVKTSQA